MVKTNNKKEEDDYEIVGLSTKVDEDTIIITSEELGKQWLEKAVQNFTSKAYTSSYYNDTDSKYSIITEKDIDMLSYNAQSSLRNILKINQMIRYFINKDDLLGKVYESIESNINSEYELKYPKFEDNEDEQYEIVKELIEDFNEKIDVENLIIKSIPLTFIDGNYGMYLRKDINNKNYKVDHYPLGVLEVSEVESDGEPYLLVNINELTNRLRKTYKKNKKGKPLFFDSLDKEIEANYPKEINDAYTSKEQYAKLTIENTGILRINNMNRKYGLSPMFKALKPMIRLDEIESSDIKNFKAKGKKIIHQVLRKELLDDRSTVKWNEGMAFSHDGFIGAWKNDPVIYTSAPWVEKIEYIEPKTESVNTNTINSYRTKIMTALGIGFLNAEKGSLGVAEVSIKELMKMIDKIIKQLESIINKWYKGLLKDKKIDMKYSPKIQILKSELLETSLKIELADVLFNKFGMSFESTFKMLGRDFETEKIKRQQENDEQLDSKVFYARQTAYTFSSKGKEDYENKGGHPTNGKDADRQEYDKQRYQEES